MKNKGIIIFTVVIFIIITGFFLFNSFLKKNVIESDVTAQEEVVEEEMAVSLIVPQQAGGTNIFIENAFLLEEGYVVIHREEDGKSGEIIGVSELLQVGANDNFLMDIDEEVIEGDILFAMLHTDYGDGVFDPLLDIPTVDSEGNSVLVKFDIVGEGALDNEIKL